MIELLTLLKSDLFATMVAELPGYSAPSIGEVVRLEEALPQLVESATSAPRAA